MNKIISKIFFAFIFTTVALLSFGQTVSIEINNSSYKNKTIQIYRYSDMLTRTPKLLYEATVGEDGILKCSFEIAETQEIFALSGSYKLNWFVDPGKSYELIFPPYSGKSIADELNPYFEHVELYAGVKGTDKNEINRLISQYDKFFNENLEKYFNYLYRNADKRLVDSLIILNDSIFPKQDNEFFEAYKYYKISYLKFFALERDPIWATKQYFLNKPILYHNEAYMHFFLQLYGSYFSKGLHHDHKIKMRENIIYDKSSRLLKETMSLNRALRNDTLQELIILQGLYGAFSDPEKFPRNTVYQTLDSLEIESSLPYHRTIAQNIRKDVFKLFPGDDAPDFTLKNVEGQEFTLESFKGKFIYLNLCRSENYACTEDYKLIKAIEDSKFPDLEVVTLSFDQNKASFKQFMKVSPQYTWEFLYAGDNKELLEAYQCKVMPSYYLIAPNGIIAMLPAASPHEDFKIAYGALWKSWKRAEAKKLQEGENRGN